jgi:hypothetical protein
MTSPQERASLSGNDLWPIALAGLVCSAFVYAGFRSIRGTAWNTLGYGVISIICGVSISAYGVLLAGLLGFVLAGIFLVVGGALLVAGILAIRVRNEYTTWRRPRKKPLPPFSR